MPFHDIKFVSKQGSYIPQIINGSKDAQLKTLKTPKKNLFDIIKNP